MNRRKNYLFRVAYCEIIDVFTINNTHWSLRDSINVYTSISDGKRTGVLF